MHSLSLQLKSATIFSMILLAASPVITHRAFAVELSVTGNGEGSVNEANVSNASTTQVTSNNTAEVNNDIQINANTGNNSASGNNGEATQVTTGDVVTETTVVNEMNKTVVEQQPCCSQSGVITVISNNGSNSKNTAQTTNTNNTHVTVNQHAQITNNVKGTGNTGGNTANNNAGNVSIKTGNITVKDSIYNTMVNRARVSVNQPTSGGTLATVIGNGTDTTNTINFLTNNAQTVVINNYADIFNNVIYDLSTGNNHANDNTGNVSIETGDIDVTVEIVNDVNKSEVEVKCDDCREKPEKPTPTPPADKVTPTPPSPEKPTSHGGNGGEVASVSVGKELPVTGMNWLLLAIIGNVMMLFLGMILRLRSGNAPGAVAL